jgi:hypothetical protein
MSDTFSSKKQKAIFCSKKQKKIFYSLGIKRQNTHFRHSVGSDETAVTFITLIGNERQDSDGSLNASAEMQRRI